MRRLVPLGAGLWLAACAPSVAQLCDDLAQECPRSEHDYDLRADECTDDGERLEDNADDAGCDGTFDDYLECVDDQRCAWNTRCKSLRDQLDRCLDAN